MPALNNYDIKKVPEVDPTQVTEEYNELSELGKFKVQQSGNTLIAVVQNAREISRLRQQAGFIVIGTVVNTGLLTYLLWSIL